MAKKIRLGYDILSKRAIETESGINIDEALRRKNQEIADINTAITNIEGDITDIQAVIPDDASSDNKLITTDQVEQKISDVLSNSDLIYLDDINGDDTNDGLTKNTSVRTIAGAIRAFKDAQENNSYFKTVKIYLVTESQETPIQIASDEDLSILTNYSNGIWLYGKSITLANTVGTPPLIVHYSLHIIAENVTTYITRSDDVSSLYLKVECVNYSGYCMTTGSIEIEASSNISLNGTSGPGDDTHARPNMFLRSNGQIYVSSGPFYCNMVNMTAMESINVYGDIYVSYSYGLFRSLEGTVSFYKGLTAVDTNGNYLNVYIDSCYGVSILYGITCGDLIINAGKKYSKIYNNTVNISAANYIYGDMIVKCHTFAPGSGAHMYHGNVCVKAEEINMVNAGTFNIAGYAVFDSNTYYTGPSSMYVTKMIVNARNVGLSNTTSTSYSLFAYTGSDKKYSETSSKYIFNIDSDNFYTRYSNIQNRNTDVTINCKGKVYISDDGALNGRSLDLKCRDLYINSPVFLGFFNIDVENMIEMRNPTSNIYMRLIGADSTTSDTVSYDTRYDNTLKCGSLYCSIRASSSDGSYGLIHTHYGNAVKNIDIQVGMLLCPSYNTTGAGGTMTPQVLGKCESGGHTFNSTISGHVGGYVGYNGPGTINVSAWDHDIRQIPPSYGNVIIDPVPGSSNNINGVITLKFDDVYETNHFYFDPDQGDDTLDGCTRQTAVKSVTALVHAIMKKTGGTYNSDGNYFSINNPVSIHILSVCYGNNRNTNYNPTAGYVYAGLNDWMYNGGYNGDNTPNGILFDLVNFHGGCRVQFNFLEFIPESPGMSLYARSFNASTLVAKGFRDIGLVGYGSGGFNYLEATGLVALNNSWSNGGYYYYESRLGPLNISARDIVLYGWFNCLTAKAENSIHIIDTYGGDSTTSNNCCLYGLTTLEAEDIYLGEAFTYSYSSGGGGYTQYKIGLSGILNIRARNSIYCRVDTVDGLVFMDAGNQITGGFADYYFRGQLHAKCLESYLTSGTDSDYQTGYSYSYYSFSTYTAADRGGAGIIDIQASKQLIVSGWGTSGSGDCYLYGVDLYLKAALIAGTSSLYLCGNNGNGKILVDGDELYIGLKPYYYNYIFIKSQHCATPQALNGGGSWTDTGGYTYINLDIGKLRNSIQLPTYVSTRDSSSIRTYEITGRIGLMNNQVLYWGQTVDPDNPPTLSGVNYNFSIVVGHVTNSGHGIDKTGWVPDNSGTVIVLNDQKQLVAGQGIVITDRGDELVMTAEPKSNIVEKPVTIDNGTATVQLTLNRYNVITGIDDTVTDLVIDFPVESTATLLTEIGFEFYLDGLSRALNSVTFTNSTEQFSSVVPDEFTPEHIYQGVLVNRCITLVEYDRPDTSVLEINGKKYRTVKIGEQTWMAENLSDPNSGVWYDNDQATYEPLGYGKLYTYNESIAIANSVPGWHLPYSSDFASLESSCGGEQLQGRVLKSTTGWNNDGNGDDTFGFNAKPSGYGSGVDGGPQQYYNNGYTFAMMSNILANAGDMVNVMTLNYDSDSSSGMGMSTSSSIARASVRLVKDMSVNIGGRDYRVVQIGNQLWMAENLDWKFNTLNFRDSLNNPLDSTTAIQAAYYNYDESTYGVNGNKYGLLYNWYAVDYLNQHLSDLGIPDGWHVPTRTELSTLVSTCDTDVATKLKSTTGWNNSSNGTDYYGFSLVPAGLQVSSVDTNTVGNVGFLSLSDEYSSGSAYYGYIDISSSTIEEQSNDKTYGLSVRLVKNLT